MKTRHYRNPEEIETVLAYLKRLGMDVPQNPQAITEERAIDGKSIRVGFAFCSQNDQFSRKTGRELAMERAGVKEVAGYSKLDEFIKKENPFLIKLDNPKLDKYIEQLKGFKFETRMDYDEWLAVYPMAKEANYYIHDFSSDYDVLR